MIELKNILRANALSCIIFGIIFVLIPAAVTDFLSQSKPAPEKLFFILGLGLILNGLHLFWASLKPVHNKILIMYFSLSDFLWLTVSFGLVIFGVWVTTAEGVIATTIVAAIVGFMGFLQILQLKQDQ